MKYVGPRRIQVNAAADGRLLADPGIIRSRVKIQATVSNAQAYLEMQSSGEGFSEFVWGLAGGAPLRNEWSETGQIPARSPTIAVEIPKALKKRGFKVVGPVIVYAWMQAVGMVDDHLVTCFRRCEP